MVSWQLNSVNNNNIVLWSEYAPYVYLIWHQLNKSHWIVRHDFFSVPELHKPGNTICKSRIPSSLTTQKTFKWGVECGPSAMTVCFIPTLSQRSSSSLPVTLWKLKMQCSLQLQKNKYMQHCVNLTEAATSKPTGIYPGICRWRIHTNCCLFHFWHIT